MDKKPIINKISDNYQIVKILGYGSFGQVLECLKKDTQETVAVKVIKRTHEKDTVIREVRMLEKIRVLDADKSNFVKCYDTFTSLDRTFLVFEALDISLFDYIFQTKCAPVPLEGIRTVLKNIATALNCLKDLGMIHTDIKLDNIMLLDHKRQPFQVKLIDFGLTLFNYEARPGLAVQHVRYRSPEIILGLPFDEAIDIWSLGTVLSEMLLGFSLFPGKHNYEMLRFITDLLGAPGRRLLRRAKYTKMFFNEKEKYFRYKEWTLKTPAEIQQELDLKYVDSRRTTFLSLDDLKKYRSTAANREEEAERGACVDLLKEMFQIDPRIRITPDQISEHPFITKSYLLDLNPGIPVVEKKEEEVRRPPSTIVIRVQPANKAACVENASYTDVRCWSSSEHVQRETVASLPKWKKERERKPTPAPQRESKVCVNDLKLESITESKFAKAAKAPNVKRCVIPNVKPPPKQKRIVEPEREEPKKKKKKNKLCRIFSTLRRKVLSCFGVEDNRVCPS